jgi:hypothetical protein
MQGQLLAEMPNGKPVAADVDNPSYHETIGPQGSNKRNAIADQLNSLALPSLKRLIVDCQGVPPLRSFLYTY